MFSTLFCQKIHSIRDERYNIIVRHKEKKTSQLLAGGRVWTMFWNSENLN